ncbi:MAG: glycosyltransferase, partial [Thermoplasmata archaeon]
MRVAMLSRHEDPLDSRIYHKEAKSLQEAGHDVVIIQYVRANGILKIEEGDHHVHFHPVASSGGNKVLDMWKSTEKLAEAVCNEKPDVIHCHDLETLPSGVKALKKRKVPLVFDAHEDFHKIARQSSYIYGRWWSFVQKRCLPHVDRIVTVNEIMARVFRDHDPVVVKNYPPLWFGGLGSDRMREFYAPDDEAIILYHGCLNEARGPNVMRKIANRITEKYDAKFLFLVRIFDNVQIPQTERIRVLNQVPWLQVPDYLRMADIGFCAFNPTEKYRQATPVKIFECMLFGKPFVANEELPVVRQLINETSCGLPTRFEEDHLVRNLSTLIDDDKLRATLGEAGRAAVERKYNWERQA